jgi:hypothetical protein
MEIKEYLKTGETCQDCGRGIMAIVRTSPAVERAGFSSMSFKCSQCEIVVVQEQVSQIVK